MSALQLLLYGLLKVCNILCKEPQSREHLCRRGGRFIGDYTHVDKVKIEPGEERRTEKGFFFFFFFLWENE